MKLLPPALRAPALVLVCLAGLCVPLHGVDSREAGRSSYSARGGFIDVTEAVGLGYPPAAGNTGKDSEADGRPKEDGGLTLADIDNDGRLELYVAYGNRLFGWNGARFESLEGNSGIAPTANGRAGYVIDLDEDGWPDFLSIQTRRIRAYRNDGTGRFAKIGNPFGDRRDRATHSIAAADYDNDGDLDLFFAHWSNVWNGVRPPSRYLWRNGGGGRFEDMSHIVPVRPGRLSVSKDTTLAYEMSFSPTFADIDGDGDPDLLLAGDFRTSQVLRNESGRVFTDITDAAITDDNGMGAAVGDYDGDGHIDWFVTSIHDVEGRPDFGPTGNRLYRNRGDGRFEDTTAIAGVREGGWGWGACLADFDNDGHRDLFHTNGWFDEHVTGPDGEEREVTAFLEDPSRLFMSNGDGTFTERAAELGIEHTGQGRGVVCADYDGDGRVDILIANHSASPTVYRNVFEGGNHWLAIDLAGRHANRRGIGARVTVRAASGVQVQEVRFGGSYLSQAPPTLHFGLGADSTVHSIEVIWPGPGRAVSRLDNVAADRRLTIREPAPAGSLLRVSRGTGAGLYRTGAKVAVEAEAGRGHYRFSHWTSDGGGAFGDAHAPRTVFTMPSGPATVTAHYLPGPALSREGVSVARRWSEVLLQAIRDDLARPTVHARNLFHLSAAMYDAWAAYSRTARPYLFGNAGDPCPLAAPPPDADVRRDREEAISHAAWRLLRHRFRDSPGGGATARNADTLMAVFGYGTDPATATPAATLGVCIAEHYIARGLSDGANEAYDYASPGYRPVNLPLNPHLPGNPNLEDPDRWQPLHLPGYVDQSGHRGSADTRFVSPEWGRVLPFALSEDDLSVHTRDGVEYRVYHDPGPPPALHGPLSGHHKWGFALVAHWSAHLSPDDGAVLDISPAGIGNVAALPRRLEDYASFYGAGLHGPGHSINPATGAPYRPQIVPRGDYARVLAEFWADGPDSETPPGHWFVILNAVGDHQMLERRIGGSGPLLDALEWDVKAYFALGGAMHDAAIAAWGIKGRYDTVRPVSALRAMASRGQSTDPALPSWAADGIPLKAGAIELVGAGDPLAGEDGAHVGKVKLRAWRGPAFIDDPGSDAAGVGWILVENWWPYQRPSFVTPPFAGYVSGHSTFSRAAAEVLTALTGDPFFPGGMSGFRIAADDFLVFERGPSVDMTLQWATYRDAADQCSLSRIWGGIHPPVDDIPGRIVGARVGRDAYALALSYFGDGGNRAGR